VRNPGSPNSAFVIVVILNWDNLADTLQCMESVRKSDYPRLAVWIADNGSDEDPSDRKTPSQEAIHRRSQDGLGQVHRTLSDIGLEQVSKGVPPNGRA